MSANAPGDDLSHEMMALAAEIKRLDDGERSELARAARLVMLRFIDGLAMALDRIPDRAEEIAVATVREGVTTTRRLLTDIGSELATLCRQVQAIKLGDEAERRRLTEILDDPLAAYSPALALTLCAHGLPAATAIEILRMDGINVVPPSADLGGSRAQ